MSVGKDDAVVTDAFVTLAAGGPPEAQIPTGSLFFVNVEVEAGTNAILTGGPYTLQVLLQDITNFVNILVPPPATQTGFLNAGAAPPALHFTTVPAWNAANTDFTFVITVPVVAGAPGTIYKIIAVLSLGAAQQDVETFESEKILVTK